MRSFEGKRVAVAGLGRFGGNIAAAKWLVGEGARVLVTDPASPEALAESVAQLEGLPIDFRLGEHRTEDFTSADVIVASPAIAPSSPYLRAARAAGVPVTTEIRLFVERCPAPIVGVTGTKGKSTTTEMLGRMLRAGGQTWVGGNIGRSLLADLPAIATSDRVVLELSSFMLDYLGEIRWSPHIALVTLIAADHLDWHGSKDAYLAAKANILRFQRPQDYAVLNAACADMVAIASKSGAAVETFPASDAPPFDLSVPGAHNQLNAQAAFAAAKLFGVTFEQAQAAVADFRGLPHRLQLPHEADGVRYYNDSIATIPEAAVAALESFPAGRVIQIVGGSGKKGLPMEALRDALRARARAVLCIGETGPRLADDVARDPGAPAVHRCQDLATAVAVARRIAASGDIVLLSTGCASYDQFPNFEARGEAFQRLVKVRGGALRAPSP